MHYQIDHQRDDADWQDEARSPLDFTELLLTDLTPMSEHPEYRECDAGTG